MIVPQLHLHSRRKVLFPSIALLAFVSACGTRTGLLASEDLAELDAGVDGSPIDAAEPRDARTEAGRDASQGQCATSADCDDAIRCTVDTCARGACVHVADDTRCDDHLACTGTERCDPERDCQSVAAPACDDHVACTRDGCTEAAKGCTFVPDDSLCPAGQLCSAHGCGVFAYVVTNREFYEVELPGAALRRISDNAQFLSDIGLHPSGVLYGVAANYPSSLYVVDRVTGVATVSEQLSSENFVGLDVGPDGAIYGTGDDGLYAIDLQRGATPLAKFPPPLRASGDLAVVDGVIYATATQSIGIGSDTLVRFERGAATGTVIGLVGERCVYGLAAFGTTLYGFTCEGKVLRIDLATAVGTTLETLDVSFNGATAR